LLRAVVYVRSGVQRVQLVVAGSSLTDCAVEYRPAGKLLLTHMCMPLSPSSIIGCHSAKMQLCSTVWKVTVGLVLRHRLKIQ